MADEAEAAFQEAWGEDANHADVPEELLDGGSFLDNCLAASTPDSARKIMVKWRGQNVGINTAADQKYLPCMVSMRANGAGYVRPVVSMYAPSHGLHLY
jgi:hypothetical protein